MDSNVIACIPCFNGEGTLRAAIESLQRQNLRVIIIDDGSTDHSASLAESLGATVFRNAANLGRGAARARALRELTAEFIVFCDAGVALAGDFCERALAHFKDANVAAVFGQIIRQQETTAIDRWEGRHLFRSHRTNQIERANILVTNACVLRREPILRVGNFDSAWRESEDAELGGRLHRAGWTILFDPALHGHPIQSDTLGRALERYSRWNTTRPPRWREYPRLAIYGVKTMAALDLQKRDPLAALISAFVPHYQFWRARLRPRQQP